ncbi:MAG: heavy metal-associated domain-containing protein, partial [Dehalococcoidales bacterium]|nr:heavy metal-associated domain-containing protein [Dehalococcoidales bacterium]
MTPNMQEEQKGQQETKTPDRGTHVIVPVTGMSCAACAANVTNALKEVSGVRDARVNLATGQALVEIDPAKSPVLATLEKA